MEQIREDIELICKLFKIGTLTGWRSAEQQLIEGFTEYIFWTTKNTKNYEPHIQLTINRY